MDVIGYRYVSTLEAIYSLNVYLMDYE